MAPLIPIAISLAAKYVPELIEHFSGKNAAGVASKVIEIAQDATGTETPDEAAKALAANPELALKFKTATLEQQTEFARLALEEVKVGLADVASARDMQKEALGQDDPLPKRFVYYLATAWSLFAMVYIFWITFYPIPAANQRFADTILGFLLGTVIAMILQFFFGSSQGSVKAQQMFRDIISARK